MFRKLTCGEGKFILLRLYMCKVVGGVEGFRKNKKQKFLERF